MAHKSFLHLIAISTLAVTCNAQQPSASASGSASVDASGNARGASLQQSSSGSANTQAGAGGTATGMAQQGLLASLPMNGMQRATGLPGIMLSNTASGSASGMLSATGKNVHLDSGTELLVNVAAQRQ